MPRANGGVSMTQPARSSARNRSHDEAEISRSQPTGRTQEQDADTSQLVSNAVKVLLNLSVNKHPIKRPDVVKNALGGNGRLLPKLLPLILEELKEVYGYKLVETERKNFLLVSLLPCGSVLDLDDEFRRKYTLLYLVLGYIFMKNGNVPEPGLWEFLGKLNINDDGEEHPFFGDVRTLIGETFIKQAYLNRTKQVLEGMTEERFVYDWGERAYAELSKKDILESICKLMGKPSIVYVKQHMAAYGGEEDEEETDASQMDASQD